MNQEISRCGYVAIVGRPNVGKSTLLNLMVGEKVSIVSPKPQTTRNQILGIKTDGPSQAVFIDTPGLHKAERRAMNRYMNRLASAVIIDADVVLFVIEATRWDEDDEAILERLKQTKAPVILVINKMDKLKEKKLLLPIIEKMQGLYDFSQIIPISASKDINVEDLEHTVMEMLPEGEHMFPDDQITDKDVQFQVAEIIREKLIKATEQEIPYSTTVLIEELKQEGNLLRIGAVILVERESQKPIVIGKDGDMLKKIGTLARKEIETLLNTKVFLRLWVKVKDNWTDDERVLGSLGFE